MLELLMVSDVVVPYESRKYRQVIPSFNSRGLQA